MGKQAEPQSREERLAAQLRENLRRRKQQARSMAAANESGQPADTPPAET